MLPPRQTVHAACPVASILFVLGAAGAACGDAGVAGNCALSGACGPQLMELAPAQLPQGDEIALLQTSQEVKASAVGSVHTVSRSSVKIYSWEVRKTTSAMFGHHRRTGTQMSTAALLVLLLVAIPSGVVLFLVALDYCMQSDKPLKNTDSSSSEPLSMGASLHEGSALGEQSLRSRSFANSQHDSAEPSLTTTVASTATSGQNSLPFPPMVPKAIMPTMEAHFMVTWTQLTSIRREPIQVRGSSLKTLLNVSFSQEMNGDRKLELVPVQNQSDSGEARIFSIANRVHSPVLEIHGRKEEVYANVHMADSNRAVLNYKESPQMVFTLGDPKRFEMTAALIADGKPQGSGRVEESQGKKLWVVRVNPGADWLCIITVFLGMIAMPLPA